MPIINLSLEDCLDGMMRPAALTDWLVSFCCRRGWWQLAMGLTYHGKADHAVARIKWHSESGNTFYLSPNSFIDRLLLSSGTHDPEVIDCLREVMQPGDVFWDIGANIGFVTLEVARACPDAEFFCFEPSPWISSQLLANARASGRKLTLFSIALSNRAGLASLNTKFSGNVGQTGLKPNQLTKYDDIIQVATARGDELVESGLALKPNVIKLDVEGHEREVLEGLSQQLSSNELRVIVYENCDIFEESHIVADILINAGFELRKLPGGKDNWLALRARSGTFT